MKKKQCLILFLLMSFLFNCCSSHKKETKSEQKLDTIPVLVMQIRKCAKLYTTEYHVHKIITHDDDIKIQGNIFGKKISQRLPFSQRKIAIPIDATLKAYIDFSNFSEKNVLHKGNKIEIILPDANVEITSSKINHKELHRKVSLFRSNFSDKELTNYEQQGRAAILNNVSQMNILESTRQAAAHVLVPIITQMGYEEKDITITFSKNFTPQNMFEILHNSSVEDRDK